MKYIPSKWIIFGFVGIFISFILTRLINLSLLPIFTDEAIYIRWSQIGSQDASWRFISLTDGKQPMFTWAVMASMRFINDPLMAGRLVSGVSGFFTLLGIIGVACLLFRSWKTGLVAATIYVILPFTLFYDRLALYDSMVSMFSIWSIFGAIVLVRTLRLDVALLLGMIVGGGTLNKTSGFLSVYLLPTTALFLSFPKSKKAAEVGKWIGLMGVVFILSQIIYGILRLSPYFHLVAEKNTIFVYPLAEWIHHPLRFVEGNLRGMLDWLQGYMSVPLFVLAIVSLLLSSKFRTEKLFLYTWWIIPFVGLATFGRVLYPRFILFMTIPLVIIVAQSMIDLIVKIKNLNLKIVFILLCLIPSINTSRLLITNPLIAPIPFSDRGQLMDDWPSGYGVPETLAFFKQEAANDDIAIYTEGTFGLFPYAYEIYLINNPKVLKIEGIWPLPDVMPSQMIESAQKNKTYFVLNQQQVPPEKWKLQLINQYQKGTRTDKKLRLYQVLPK